MRKRDLNIYSVYHCNQYGDTLFQIALIETKHELNLMRNKREQKYTPPKCESNTDDEDDVWYFDNGASNHMTGNYSYFYELNENNTGRVRFGDGSCVSIKGKGSILFQGKNKEQKLLKYVYYIPALRSNVISLGQATISGYDISIRGDFLTMRDSWGGLLIKVPRSANRLYKAQLKVGKEDTNEVGRESGWKIHHLHFKMAFIHGDLKLASTLKEMGFLQCVQVKAVYRKVPNGEYIIVAVNVDDLFMTETSLDLINEFKKRMVSQFEMSDLGELTYYLGIEVLQEKDCVEIKQERYAMKILKEAGMEDCNKTLCPMELGLKLSKAED
ncbi:uncharacterized mitochondrial protein-like protein [Tanacetum coccineum]|uniref:Uncharacterized mitochondrial protein-like protein n=1 Tax=Tanacetum coccineum TaxID=301880 RepID=A0ABQ4Z3B1_9ASTR